MPGRERHYGSVPPTRRRLFVLSCLALATLVAIGGLIVDAVTDSPVRWGWLLVAAGFAAGLYALYLWIRLSD